jgi:hypothetical protein
MAWNQGGRDGALAAARELVDEVRVACLLTGSRSPAALQEQPVVLDAALRRWVPRGSPLERRAL